MLCWCPEGVKMSMFRDENVRLIFDRQTTNFLLKHCPLNEPGNRITWVSIFSTFFDAALNPCFHDFVSTMDSNMVSKKQSVLRPFTFSWSWRRYLCQVPVWTPSKTRFLSMIFFDLFFRLRLDLKINLSWQWNGKRVGSVALLHKSA